MTDLSTLLAAPITWMNAATDPDIKALLDDLQANILKGHGRHHTAHIFLSFAGMPQDDASALVRTLGLNATSAYGQLRRNKKYPPYRDGGSVLCVLLAASGYVALGLEPPAGEAFRAGMAPRGNVLADPPRASWGQGWTGTAPDAMVLLADSCADAVTKDLELVEGWLNGTGAKIITIERGFQQTREFRPGKPEGVEHFGYVDGRSQPLFLTEDITAEAIHLDPPETEPGAKLHWDPAFPPAQVLVADPHGGHSLSAGSYFVFRKLEQNVRGFNAAEDKLADDLFGTPTPEEKDRAGAMVVGRFEDGSPLTLFDREQLTAVTNDFTYARDANGAICPFHAHIRKVNPRGDIERTFGAPESAGRNPIMARRGITYGAERPHTPDKKDFDDAGREPERDVGLLFMAYMASIEAQFEFTQQSWANNPDFVRPGTGIDPVIGQSANPSDRNYKFADGWTGGPVKVLPFDQFVTMLGGEYFFAPSLSFLRAVGV